MWKEAAYDGPMPEFAATLPTEPFAGQTLIGGRGVDMNSPCNQSEFQVLLHSCSIRHWQSSHSVFAPQIVANASSC